MDAQCGDDVDQFTHSILLVKQTDYGFVGEGLGEAREESGRERERDKDKSDREID